MTSLAEERAAQAPWDACALGDIKSHHALIENEFQAPERLRDRVGVSLTALMRFAGRHVPHYRAQFRTLGINPSEIDGFGLLSALPILSKLDIQSKTKALLTEALPPGDRIASGTESSGTTARPTRVFHSKVSTRMFSVLVQRQHRWFRLDPQAKLASIRLGSQLPKKDGAALADGGTGQFRTWHYLGGRFRTGPFVGFNVTNPVEEQIAWLRREQPEYLISYAESLEHLAFAAGAEQPAKSLRALISISEQLTPGMKARITQCFGTPIHQSYGLNEIGLVACRCKNGRYHVHVEHCLCEILDDDGRECASGETGRLIVTALNNLAQPLIRYDTGDLAKAVAGPCPCGRTLPAFGEIVGRYSRIAFLPEGTLGLVDILRRCIEEAPADISRDLHQFQIHQSRDNGFEIRLATRMPLPEAFAARIRTAWDSDAGARALPLRIVEVREIARSAGGKFQVFTSDFMPLPDQASGAPPT
ncbi:MAG: phenylacetate--CoA ligase family protein [Alphaproteobacteria bacterium]